MEELKSEIVIKIKENSYNLTFPTVGKLIEIERKKANYQDMSMNTMSGLYAKTMASAIATFEVLIPKLSEDLNVKDFFNLTVLEMKPILKAYTTQFLPWWNKWIEEINILEDEG